MRILAVGDVVGRPGRRAIARWLPGLVDEHQPDLVIVNGENLRAGRGIDAPGLTDLFDAGADVVTTGNHVWAHRSAEKLLEEFPRVLRPANLPEPCPGRGAVVVPTEAGVRVAVINLLGRVFMTPCDCPFRTADRLLERLGREADVVVVDFHAEATSEKKALALHLDGRVAAVFGTHTHVPTADAQVLPGGTGFLTDLGMTGPHDSVIGLDSEVALRRFLAARPVPQAVAEGGLGLHGAVFEIDEGSGRSTEVVRVARGGGGR